MKKKLILMTGVALLAIGGNTAINASNRDSVGADEVPPIVAQVNEHENRITETEAKNVEQDNKIADNDNQVNTIKERTTVVEKKIETQVNTPAPTPAPAPRVLAEGEITSVKQDISPSPEYTGACIYTVNTSTRYKSVTHYLTAGQSCKKVGDLIN